MYEYLADIRPDGGTPAFRASLFDPTNAANFRQPEVGEVVRVKFRDSARRQHGSMKWRLSNVKFDQSDPSLHGRGGYRDSDKLAVAMANSPEAQGAWDALAAAGPGTPVEPAGGDPPPSDQASPSAGSAPRTRSDPLERLRELADLRDRGALTDEEFKAEKARILGEG